MSIKTVSVVGLGYIGLPTAAVIASSGYDVIGVDVNADTVATINRGEIHIIEPRLDQLVARVVAEGRLRATTVVEPADAFLVAVPTPFRDGFKPDLRYVESASRAIAPALKPGDVVILESTSPVGATEQMASWLAQARPDLRFPAPDGTGDADIAVAYCPERVLPGNVLHELVHNDRVVGGLTRRCSELAASVYALFVEGDCIVTNARTAEMCKLAENSFRDTNIAFANELSIICDQLGVDVWETIALANRHPRVSILQPGPGVGGHCIAIDPWFIVDSAPEKARLIRTARTVNDTKPDWVVEKVREAIAAVRGDGEGMVTIACLGLAFKANIDDLRESPALDICTRLTSEPGCRVLAAEPHIDALPKGLAGRVELVDAASAVERADIVVLLVDHKPFSTLADPTTLGKRLIDTRGFWSRRQHAQPAPLLPRSRVA